MTKETIEKRIKEIKECAGDDEMAHILEDRLRSDFIEWVAENCPGYVGENARLVLSTDDIEFSRWCA